MESGIEVKNLLKTIEVGPPNERWRAAHRLVELDQPLPKSDFLKIFDIDDIDVKRAVLYVLGGSKKGSHLSALIIKGLENKNSSVFRTACETARKLRYTPAAKLISVGLKSKSVATIVSSLHGLEYVWSDEYFESVINIFKTHKSIKVKKAAAYPLWMNASHDNWISIFSEFSIDDIDRHRIIACKIAFKFGDKDIIKPLMNLTLDKNGHVRWHSKQALIRIHG